MNLSAKPWSASIRRQSAITQMLVHLPNSVQGEALIDAAVQLARHCEARLRGLTIVDTSELEDVVTTCESAAYAVFLQQRLEEGEGQREQMRARFSQACLAAGLDFDLHRKTGRMLDILRGESRHQDLSLASVRLRENQEEGDLSASSVADMIHGGISPLLVLREKRELPERILLIQDGSAAGSRALRAFLTQDLFPEATVRLLAVAPTVTASERILRESVDAVQRRLKQFETGYVAGRPSRVIPQYVQQWEADLVVMGMQRKPPLLGRFLGEAVSQVLNKTSAALYSAS